MNIMKNCNTAVYKSIINNKCNFSEDDKSIKNTCIESDNFTIVY